jgi:hypothetical protein
MGMHSEGLLGRLRAWLLLVSLAAGLRVPVHAQILVGPEVWPVPTDAATFPHGNLRNKLPCKALPVKPQVGFDLRFHSGYTVTIPLRKLSGAGHRFRLLTRVTPVARPQAARYFADWFSVPPLQSGLHGEASVDGKFVLGPGRYTVDWIMREGAGRVCSDHWRLEAKAPDWLEQGVTPVAPNLITEYPKDPFTRASPAKRVSQDRPLHVKLLVNFSPSDASGVTLKSWEIRAIVSIMRSVTREPQFGRFSLVAFSTSEERILFRQNDVLAIDFQTLGKVVNGLSFGTIDYERLTDPMSEARFLGGLLTEEARGREGPKDAIIIIGPKVMTDKKNLRQTLRSTVGPSCPIFYLNYNSDPRRNPWRDALSAALKVYRGFEYAIAKPRDLASALGDMRSRLSSPRRVLLSSDQTKLNR